MIKGKQKKVITLLQFMYLGGYQKMKKGDMNITVLVTKILEKKVNRQILYKGFIV